MEEGCLYKHVKLAKKFSEEETSTKLQEICEAVKYLHTYDILHRDIKPENIVISNVYIILFRVFASYVISGGQSTAKKGEIHIVAL